VDTSGSDANNCGGCGAVCPEAAACQAGGDYTYQVCQAGACTPIHGACAPYRCDETTMMSCQTSCIAGDSAHNCLGKYYCDTSHKCQAQKGAGSSCTDGAMCLSNQCSSGKCT
jgi:hypothetical protein